MPALRYSVAASLDGYIAGPNGEFDWIVVDPEIDFAAMYASYGGLVMGRKSYDVFVATGGAPGLSLPTYVYSRTLPEGQRDGVTFVREAVPHLRELKKAGGDTPLWLWGGGELFRQCAEAGLVDGVEVAVIPILLGGGIPLLPTPGPRLTLRLRSHVLYSQSGTVNPVLRRRAAFVAHAAGLRQPRPWHPWRPASAGRSRGPPEGGRHTDCQPSRRTTPGSSDAARRAGR